MPARREVSRSRSGANANVRPGRAMAYKASAPENSAYAQSISARSREKLPNVGIGWGMESKAPLLPF